IVLKHHDGLQRRFAREFSVCLAVDDLGANTVVRILPLRIEHAELESRPQQDGQLAINFLLSNKSLLYGIKQSVVLRTAVQPYARLDSHGSCLSLCSDDLMSRVQVTHRTAVAYYVSFETPLIAENIRKQCVAGTAGFTVGAIIGTHDRLHAGINKLLEGGKVCFVKIFRGADRVKLMPQKFGSAVHGVVLFTCSRLQVHRMIALQTF